MITNRDKMIELMDNGVLQPDDLLLAYIKKYPQEFSLPRLVNIISTLNSEIIYPRSLSERTAIQILDERVRWVKSYLEGNMYDSRESAEKHVNIQIRNLEEAIKKGEEVFAGSV